MPAITASTLGTVSGTALPITVPPGDPGDVLLLWLNQRGSSSFNSSLLGTQLAGWTVLYQAAVQSNSNRVLLAAVVRSGSTPSSFTLTMNASTTHSAIMLNAPGLRAADLTTLVDASSVSDGGSTAASTAPLPSVTSVYDGDLILRVGTATDTTNTTPPTVSTPSGTTVVQQGGIQNPGYNCVFVAADQQSAAGATGPVTATWSRSSYRTWGTFALRGIYVGGTTAPLVANPTADGGVRSVGGAGQTVTASPTAAGVRGTASATTQTVTAAPTAAGTRGTATGTASTIFATPTADGYAGGSTTVTVTAAPTAAGALVKTGQATTTVTAAPTTDGYLSSDGVAATTAGIAATTGGRLGIVGGTTAPITVGRPASGVNGAAGGTSLTVTIVRTANGLTGGRAVLPVTAIARADGYTRRPGYTPSVERTIAITAGPRRSRVPAGKRTTTIAAPSRTTYIPKPPGPERPVPPPAATNTIGAARVGVARVS